MSFKVKREVLTAQFPEEVMCWVETHEHHTMDASKEKYIIMRGYFHELHIPNMLYDQCGGYIVRGHKFDNRSWRWDFVKMAKDLQEKRIPAHKANKVKKEA